LNQQNDNHQSIPCSIYHITHLQFPGIRANITTTYSGA